MKTKHPHYDSILAWAEGAEIETLDFNGDWVDCPNPIWDKGTKYRIKQDTFKLGDIEFTKPVQRPLKPGQEYWLIDLTLRDPVSNYDWQDTPIDYLWLERGLIHLTKEKALNYANALSIIPKAI